jgi:hypothetical protein
MVSLLSMLPLAVQGAAGLAQTIGGISKMTAKRPTYSMPNEIRQKTALAGMLANSDMPNYGLEREANENAAANAIRAGLEGGVGVSGLSAIQSTQNAGNRGLAEANNNWKASQMQNWQNALAEQAKYKDQEWQMNTFAPYADRMQQGRQLLGSGLSNIIGAGTSLMGANQYDQMLSAYKDHLANAGLNRATQDAVKMPTWETSELPKLGLQKSVTPTFDMSLPRRPLKPLSYNFMPNLSQIGQ